MTVHVGNARVSRKNRLGRSSLVSLNKAWEKIAQFRHRGDLTAQAKASLWLWRGDALDRRYADFRELARALEEAASGRRQNYYFEREGENYNLAEVVHKAKVASSSVGWDQTAFFQRLGHPGNARWENDQFSSRNLAAMLNDEFVRTEPLAIAQISQGLKRRAEQEYLLQNMVKGAMYAAAKIADDYNLGIAVRGTGLLAHQGIESGAPTKAQEFKNKTSKEVDLWLCDELQWSELGAVVHYDPRVEWSSQKAAARARNRKPPMFNAEAIEADWTKKLKHINDKRKPTLKALGPRINQAPDMKAVKEQFFKRSEEYMAEDFDYRRGHFAPHTTLAGPLIRLKLRPNANMVGDHDLFAFTYPQDYGRFAPAGHPGVSVVQTALQSSNEFQAQHGGIWYWQPQQDFHKGIKDKIMGGHSPNRDEPLVYIQPGQVIGAAYYIPAENCLKSVWEDQAWTQWLGTTHSGQLLLNPPQDA